MCLWIVKLFKMDSYSLVKEPVLQVLPFLRETMKSEQSGCIAFIDGDLQVAGRIKKGQFFAFGHIGIGIRDLFDHFISLKDDLKTPSFPLFLKLAAGDIYYDIFESVDENDLAFDPVVAKERAQ